VAGPTGFEAIREVVTDFYSELPGNALGAWAKLDSHYRQSAGQANFLDIWSSIDSVSLISISARDSRSVTSR
jgi:hypothetical protein